MATHPAGLPVFDVFGLGPDENRRVWRSFLSWGLVLTGVGTAAVGISIVAEPGLAWLFGLLLIVGGSVQLTTAVLAWEWGGLRPRAMTGAVYLALGAVIAGMPTDGAVWLTLVLAIGLAVGGVLRAGGAVAERFAGRGWVLASALLAVTLGALIGEQWPDTGLWAVGLLAGLDLAANGLAWVMFARGMKSTPTLG